MAGRTGCPLSLSHCLPSPFIRAFILSPASTYKLNFLGLKTYPASPYLEWLGVVVKVEEHDSVRCRVLNGSNGSFPFVLSRYTIQRLLLYWHRYFIFFPKLFLYRFCPFFQGDLGYAEDRIILGCVSRLIWTFITHPRLYPSSARALGPNVKNGSGPQIIGPHNNQIWLKSGKIWSFSGNWFDLIVFFFF